MVAKTVKLISVILAGIALTTACSTKRNTWLSRTYHHVNSEFNVYFNASESFKEGVRKTETYVPENPDPLPPVFAYVHEGIPGKVSSEMDRTLEKCEKLIQKHSITVKPKNRPGPQADKKERDFYNRKEFNAAVDDAYLLMGKANLYLQQYDKSVVLFEHILANYPQSSAAPEARLHLAAALVRTGDTERAQTLLDESAKNPAVVKKQAHLLPAVYADLYIQTQNYRAAADYLELALKKASNRITKARYYFILAGLYGHSNSKEAATAYLNKVIAMNLPYNVIFTAQMRKAAMYDPKTQGPQLKEDLQAMLKVEKNDAFKDQIYFALGQVEKASGNDTLAVRYLRQSVAAESSNDYQRTLAHVMLGDYAHTHQQYIDAYNSYLSAIETHSPDYLLYDSLEQKASGLRRLAENYQTIHREDSLQRIAKMPAGEREKLISDLIAKITAQEEQARQEQRQQQYSMYQQERISLGQEKNSAWYFYNTSAVNSGLSSFNMRWGKRRLEDNWRRRNKQEVIPLTTESPTQDTTGGEQPLSNKSREYYTRHLPLTPESMAASNDRLADAIFRLGEAYKDDVHEPQSAIATFRQLDERFPKNGNRASSYYYLYELYAQRNSLDSAEYYKQRLITEFPKVPLAQQLTNPNYFSEQQSEKQALEARYEKVFTAYSNQQYAEAAALAEQMIQQNPNSLLEPQLHFIRAMGVGAGGDRGAYKTALAAIVSHYPLSDAAKQATDIIARLDKQALEYTAVSGTDSIAPSTTINIPFVYNTGEHAMGIICEQSKNTAAVLFALESHNAEAHLDKNLETTTETVGENYSIILVRPFSTVAAARQYLQGLQQADALAGFPSQDYRRVLITPENLTLLQQSKDVAAYLTFFTVNY